jgi:predicted PilT family ATPase
MFDSNIWDKLEGDPRAVLILEAHVNAGFVEVLTTSIQELENQSAPSYDIFEQLKKQLKARKVPSEGFVLDFTRLGLDKLSSENSKWVTENGSRNRDEVIGQTAETNGAWLITEDKVFRKYASARGLRNHTLMELIRALGQSLPK